MKKRKKTVIVSNITTNEEEKKSVLYWLLIGAVLVFLFVAVFYRGLFNITRFEFDPSRTAFFQRPMFGAFTWLSAVLMIAAFFCFYFFHLYNWGQGILLYIWLLPLSYLVPVMMGQAASAFTSWQSFYVQIALNICFIAGMIAARTKIGSSILQQGIITAGYAVVIYGLLVWYGPWKDPAVIIRDAEGMRLTSTFTYANSYAAYLIAIIIGGVCLASASRKWYVVLFHSLLFVPCALSFILTLSRGGLVILPVIVLGILPFFSLSKQIAILIRIFVTFVAAIGVSKSSTEIASKVQEGGGGALTLQGWGVLIGASVLVAALSYAVWRYAVPFIENKNLRFSRWILPGIALAGGIIGFLVLLNSGTLAGWFPETIRNRIEAINFRQHSVQERGYFYKDAWNLISDYPLFGAGGGAWSSLYPMYQSYPYSSRQAHNYPLQYIIETGFIGFGLLVLFIGFVMFLYVRHLVRDRGVGPERKGFILFVVSISLLVHSLIDFDMSYVYLSSLLFLSLGGMIGEVPFPERWRPSASIAARMDKLRFAYPAFLIVVSLIFFVLSVRLHSGNQLIHQVYAQNGDDFRQVLDKIDRAIERQPENADYSLLSIQILHQKYAQTKDAQYIREGEERLDDLEKREPYAKEIGEYRYTWAEMQGDWEKALEYAEKGLSIRPWYAAQYEKAIRASFVLGEKAGQTGNKEEQQRYWDETLKVFAQAQAAMSRQEAIPKTIAFTPLSVTADMAVPVGQIRLMRGEYKEASETLKLGLNEDMKQPAYRQAVRWYLAALQKQGTMDEHWYKLLTDKDPSEKMEIMKIINSQF